MGEFANFVTWQKKKTSPSSSNSHQTMLCEFETKSKRVKGLSFHPTRPWILASLHTGVIQLWDYRTRTFIDKFEEHDGPVRGVCFHDTQPLFVSGGDDYKIKVWNYKQRRCLFTLLGHLDYIRTVQFHHENPWILSASDDQTIRIWNWQSRSCISILTGHNHYVMCARFHPTDPLVVSASLDQTARVWDISGLKKKNFTPSPAEEAGLPQNDLFGNTDVMVLHVLEGHDRGVNWAAFHPKDSLIVTGADDRQVKFWRMSDTKAYEVDTLRGHLSNVSSVLFHPRRSLILSDSEDKTIRVWDMSRRISLKIFRRDSDKDRFWCLASHPEEDLFAAGHDSGLIVFKLEHERPAYCVDGDVLFYIKERSLRAYNFQEGKSKTMGQIGKKTGLDAGPRFMHYNAAENAVLVTTNQSYSLHLLPGGTRSKLVDYSGDKGSGNQVCFVARNRFALLNATTNTVTIKNLEHQTTKEIPLPRESENVAVSFDQMWPASTGCVLLRDNLRSVWLFDLQRKKTVKKIAAPHVRLAIWSGNDKDAKVALLGREVLVLADRQLDVLCTVHDARMKSGAWHPSGVFIYATLNHIKYCLPNGDTGIIRTLPAPLFLYAANSSKLFCLDKKAATRSLSIDPSEFLLKLAVVNGDYQQILGLVQRFGLMGQAIIAYLQKKGYPELALHFVKDEKVRFHLAIECGNIEVALEAAKVVEEKDCWHQLGVEALRQGNHQIVEMAYQRTLNFERLGFLYLLTGNTDKLRKMLNIAEKRGDVMSQYHTGLYLGDMEVVANVLVKTGQLALAYSTAKTHNLEELASSILAQMEEKGMNAPKINPNAQPLTPPAPLSQQDEANWPLLAVQKSTVQRMLQSGGSSNLDVGDVDDEDIAGWGDDLDLDGEAGEPGDADALGDDLELDMDGGEGWDVGGDLEGLEDIKATVTKSSSGAGFVPPRPGPSVGETWCRNSDLPVDHVAAGNLESAMQLYHSQVGIVNFEPLKLLFQLTYTGANVTIPTFPSAPSLMQGVEREAGFPQLAVTLQSLFDRLKMAHKATTGGKFTEALAIFRGILHSLLFIVVASPDEEKEAHQLLEFAKEYLTGLTIELKRKEVLAEGDQKRMMELAAYFTHINMQPVHQMLSLSSAMTSAYKVKNFQDASSFAKRLLELNPKPNLTLQAKKVIAFAEKNSTNAHDLNYDERNPFVLCCASFTPIYKGSPSITCPFCQVHYLPEHAGVLCNICEVAQVGKECSGWMLHNNKSSRGPPRRR